MNPAELLGVWSAGLGRAGWQGSLLVLLIWAFCRILPAMSARVQCWFWRAALLKFLLVLLWPVPVSPPLLPAREAALVEVDRPVNDVAPVMADGAVFARLGQSDEVTSGLEFTGLRTALFAAWLLGVGVSLRKLRGARRDGAAVKRGMRPLAESDPHRPLRERSQAFALRRTPALLQTNGDGSPLLVGVFRPRSCFPPSLGNG